MPQFQHVKGHQDDQCKYDELSLPAQLNVDADELAGAHPGLGEIPTLTLYDTETHL